MDTNKKMNRYNFSSQIISVSCRKVKTNSSPLCLPLYVFKKVLYLLNKRKRKRKKKETAIYIYIYIYNFRYSSILGLFDELEFI